jgi:hypothetical protein
MKNALISVCALVVGFGAGVLTHCGRKITVQVIPGFNKPAVVMLKGDVIQWMDADHKPMTVTFNPYSPCAKSEGSSTNTCTIVVQKGMFPYDCADCDDPVVPVQGSNGTRGPTVLVKPKLGYVGVSCDPSTNTASAPPQEVTSGVPFQWIAAGENPPEKWWVTVDSGVCSEGGTEFGTRNAMLKCTAKTPGHYQYDVHVEGCPTPDGKAQLTIDPKPTPQPAN